jgi:hypothetical protein
MKWLLFLISIGWAQQILSQSFTFSTSQHWQVKVYSIKGDSIGIKVNGKKVRQLFDHLVWPSKRTRIVENEGCVFLLVETDGSPNRNNMQVFEVSENGLIYLVEAISSDLKDLDGDGFLEFGGNDLYEVPPYRDSMFYESTAYYEVSHGMIRLDTDLTRKEDSLLNGEYISHPDYEKCYVKPGFENLIFSERIDGPANIRTSPVKNGGLLFRLNDSVPVYTTGDSADSWYKIRVTVDLTGSQYEGKMIKKGSKLTIHGKTIGICLVDIPLDQEENMVEVQSASLVGYTAVRNIKLSTLPENILSQLIADHHDSLTDKDLLRFKRDFDLDTGHIGDFKDYDLSDVDTPDAMLRIVLCFSHHQLIAVIHERKLPYAGSQTIKTGRYRITIIGQPDDRVLKKFLIQEKFVLSRAG